MTILKYPEKSNIMILNTIYHQSRKIGEGAYSDDAITIIYKDLDKNKKILETIECPKIECYIVDEEHELEKPEYFVPINWTYKKELSYKNITKEIAEIAGAEALQFYWDCVKTKKYGATKELHKWKGIYGSDVDVEDYYRMKFWEQYEPDQEKMKVTKQYFDIEVDGIGIKGMPDPYLADCPVNAITLIDEETMTVFTLLLRNKDNPLIDQFESEIDSFIKDLHDSFDDIYGNLTYKIAMFDDELELISTLFNIINSLKRDFIMAWNMFGFDIPYLVNRLDYLGVSPEDIICNKDFKIKECLLFLDKKHFKPSLKTDYFKVSSYTVYTDQLTNYATIRKGGAELESYSLNSIAEFELDETKLDYSEDGSLKDLPYTNYFKFVKYNIKD